MPIIRAILTWLIFLPVPIINGFLREKWYKQKVGELAAHQIGAVVISAVFLLFVYAMLKNQIPGLSNLQLLIIGAAWLIMTLIFEFGIGLAGGRSWSYMLTDYNVLKGHIWPLVLAVIFLSPFLVKWFVNKF